MSAYLVFVGKSGEAMPVGIYDEGWIRHFKEKSSHVGTLVCVLAEDIGDALEKAKEKVRGGQCQV